MAHNELISSLIRDGYLKTPRIINAFKKIDRINFVPINLRREAYVNAPLPLGYGQTISQPLTVAFMLELLQPKAGDIILDVGSGSGWQAALLAEIVGEKGKIYAIEIIEQLVRSGRENADKYGFVSDGRIEFLHGEGSEGLAEKSPFDKIIAAASSRSLPGAWLEQVKVGGRIVCPIKTSIFLLVKKADKEFEEFEHPGFAFVPLVSRSEAQGERKNIF